MSLEIERLIYGMFVIVLVQPNTTTLLHRIATNQVFAFGVSAYVHCFVYPTVFRVGTFHDGNERQRYRQQQRRWC